jgi:hypothetical protein
LKYLNHRALFIVHEIAPNLSPNFYAEHADAFSSIRKELFALWLKNKPQQILAIVNTLLEQPKEQFFSYLFYEEMPDDFYHLLSNQLTPEQFIRIYSEAPKNAQHKLLSALISDEHKALSKLKELNTLYTTGIFYVGFLGTISDQLKTIAPNLHKQALECNLYVEVEPNNSSENDLILLPKILKYENISQEEQRAELLKLKNLQAALINSNNGACPLLLKMFDSVSKEYWPHLFLYFGSAIIYRGFPSSQNQSYSDKETQMRIQGNTWLFYKERWANILSETLIALIPNLSKKNSFKYIARSALSELNKAFIETEIHFPTLANQILKKFFLKNIQRSMEVFIELHNKLEDKQVSYLGQNKIYDQIANWLPQKTDERTYILASLLRIDMDRDHVLQTPFIRSKEEGIKTAIVLIHTDTSHFINLFQTLPHFTKSSLFKIMAHRKDFLKFLKGNFPDIGKSKQLSVPAYVKLVLMLLSYSKEANIDLFKIIDADPKRRFLLDTLSTFSTWENTSCPYELIFEILNHYSLSDTLKNNVWLHIKNAIDKDDMSSLSSCIEAFKKVSLNGYTFSAAEKLVIHDYLRPKIVEAINYSEMEMKTMADFIPDFGTLFLDLMAKKLMVQENLSSLTPIALDNLVKIYGFSHINNLCLDFQLFDCSTYLVEQYSKFPTLLHQIDEAMNSYVHFFDEHEYKVHFKSRSRFSEALRCAIIKAAKESKTLIIDINVAKLGEQSGIAQELLPLMPPLKIKSSNLKLQEEQRLSVSSMIVTRRRSGLINTPPSSEEEVSALLAVNKSHNFM